MSEMDEKTRGDAPSKEPVLTPSNSLYAELQAHRIVMSRLLRANLELAAIVGSEPFDVVARRAHEQCHADVAALRFGNPEPAWAHLFRGHVCETIDRIHFGIGPPKDASKP